MTSEKLGPGTVYLESSITIAFITPVVTHTCCLSLPPLLYPSNSPKYESFLKRLRSRIASHPDVAEWLLERIDDALSPNTPGIVAARIMITELVTNHCYHSCDNTGDAIAGGRDLAVNHGMREVMETACRAKSLPRRSWAVSSHYAFAAASRREPSLSS